VKRIVLDTNAYAAYLAGDEQVLDILAAADTTYMSVFVLGELYAGFQGGTRSKENCRILEEFLEKSTVEIVDATRETSEIFGEVRNSLKKAGKSIPINDVWIAAHAIETGSVLATRDPHFTHVPGLRLWPR
jgi:tRNA(fMet)-specific endonuclease VapC